MTPAELRAHAGSEAKKFGPKCQRHGSDVVLALLDVADQLKNTRAMIVALMKEKAIEPRTMEVIGAKMLGDIDAALAKLGSK